ncbi:1-acyl-sn-glycerol-3-phosphate acyltransferase [Marinicauda salina]|nr:1-acyl-sn-glycerol-3-phosphate acyltransferase [Marinicauda salina]
MAGMDDKHGLPAAFEADLAPGDDRHIVDRLIEERAERLRENPVLWPIVRAVFYPLLGYRKAVALADRMAGMDGREAMDFAEGFLDMSVETRGLSAVPERGACVVTANHPGGIADGIAVWEALKARRPDAVFFANRDAIRVCEGLADFVIPVEWRDPGKSREKTRETLKQSVAAFREERCVVIFPAGRMAQWNWARRGLVEQAWLPTAVSLARKFDAPVVPLGITQRMSAMFYGLGQLHEELKHMTVFHELLAKRGAHYRLSFGEALAAADLAPDDAAATDALRVASERLAWGR